jgi:hypothetical protein
MPEFGTLKRKSLREIWPNEARDFTNWLASNVGNLGMALGIDLELSESEAPVGDFSLDLLATDLGSKGKVIIENQLTKTDHDHLGKLITYGAGLSAEKVVWIAESVREEHRQALEWLNQRTDEQTQFFAVTVEVLQIDESNPAPNFKVIVSPNEWQKIAKKQSEVSTSEKAERYRDFYQNLIDNLRDNHKFTNARIGQPQNWYSFASGYSGIQYGFAFTQGQRVRAELYIDVKNAEKNQMIFDYFASLRNDLESEFGESFAWERLDNRRASRIAVYRDGSIDYGDEALQEIQEWAVKKLLDLKKVFGKRLQNALTQASGTLQSSDVGGKNGATGVEERDDTSSNFEDV